jgi:hypothetical protein
MVKNDVNTRTAFVAFSLHGDKNVHGARAKNLEAFGVNDLGTGFVVVLL